MTEDVARVVKAIEATIIELLEAQAAQREAAEAAARADHAYRQAQAVAYLRASAEKRDDGKYYTDAHKGAIVDATCSNEMLACRLAEGTREAATLRVKHLATVITAYQTVLNTYRSEADAVRGGYTPGA